jgi:peptide-methionine (R)-S-oxide reductase
MIRWQHHHDRGGAIVIERGVTVCFIFLDLGSCVNESAYYSFPTLLTKPLITRNKKMKEHRALVICFVVWIRNGFAESFITPDFTTTTAITGTSRNSQRLVTVVRNNMSSHNHSSDMNDRNAEVPPPRPPTKPTKPTVERKTWNPLRLAVLRLGLTEPMMTSPFNYGSTYQDGVFQCAYCGHELFAGSAKYDSGSGWPSFWRTRQDGSISYKMEGDGRLECKCQNCNSHLGHVFLDGPKPSTVDATLLRESPETDPRGRSGLYLPRYCINGAALTYTNQS